MFRRFPQAPPERGPTRNLNLWNRCRNVDLPRRRLTPNDWNTSYDYDRRGDQHRAKHLIPLIQLLRSIRRRGTTSAPPIVVSLPASAVEPSRARHARSPARISLKGTWTSKQHAMVSSLDC